MTGREFARQEKSTDFEVKRRRIPVPGGPAPSEQFDSLALPIEPRRLESAAAGSPSEPRLDSIRALQRTHGNAFVQRLLRLKVRSSLATQQQSSSAAGYPEAIQRFGSEEHRQLGAEAYGGESLDIDLGDGTKLTYGEMVALAGDYYGNVAEIRAFASNPGGQADLRWTRWWALHTGGEPSVDEGVKQRARDRYYRLAADNISHFRAGGTARSEYELNHGEAAGLAFEAGVTSQNAKWQDARVAEAFANHYLTDMFSSGHVRTPRQQIKEWYRARYPDSLDRFVSHVANRITNYLDHQGDIPWYWPNFIVAGKLYDRVMALGGTAVESFSLGDIISLAYHDLDNAGLGVVSDVGPDGNPVPGGYRWIAKGDSHLHESPITRQMTVAAMKASLEDLDRARDKGRKAMAGAPLRPEEVGTAAAAAVESLKPFAAEKYIPRENTNAGNVTLTWEWGALDPTLRAAVDHTVKSAIANTLRARAASVAEVIRYTRLGSEDSTGAVRLRAQAAFLEFCDELSSGGIAVIEQAMAGASGVAPVDAGAPIAGVPEGPHDASVPDASPATP